MKNNYGSTPKKYAWVYPPPKNSIFFYLTPKEILNFYNLPPRNSIGPQRGDTDINVITFSLKATGISRDLTWIPKSFGYKVFAVINQAFAS